MSVKGSRIGKPGGSRFDRKPTSTECPQQCGAGPSGMSRVTHYTGEYHLQEIPGQGTQYVEITEVYLECPRCGWIVDI